MAYSNSKLHATQSPFSLFLPILIFSLMLITNVKSDSFSFNFPNFKTKFENILVNDGANITGGVLQLTKKNYFGAPFPHTVGHTAFFGAIHLSDKRTGKVADFATEFSFVVKPKGSKFHGDGFTFFIASFGVHLPENLSDGGFLGLFTKETAFNSSKNQVVAVEFDSFTNEWDPLFPENSPHIGIDINTIESVVAAPWPIDRQPDGTLGKARVTYDSASKELRVFVSYPNSPNKVDAAISHPVDFATVLSERVIVGFTGATGQVAETHDILSWSFTSSL